MLCPDKDRMHLLVDNGGAKQVPWIGTNNRTDPELAYWIPKYILMRGDKPFPMMGYMSPPKIKALVESQDLTRWCNFTQRVHSSMKYRTFIWQSQAAISTAPIGPSSSSLRYTRLLIHSGSTGTSRFMASAMSISTKRSQKNS
jgi:hypothetical protein